MLIINDQTLNDTIEKYFINYWNNPYIPNSANSHNDRDWLSTQRRDVEPLHNLNNQDLRYFLTDYKAIRNFPENFDFLQSINHTLDVTRKGQAPNPLALASRWVAEFYQNHENNNRRPPFAVSAASKVLFFMCPKSECVIYDSNVQRALEICSNKKENYYSLNNLRIRGRFDEFKNDFLAVKTENINILKARINQLNGNKITYNEDDLDFMIRRLVDKSLWCVGND